MKTALLVALLGAIGALSRWQIGILANRYSDSLLPIGTIAVNLLGSFFLGLLMAVSMEGSIPESWRVPLAAGLLGSFTTFSTFSVETITLLQQGQPRLALLNLTLQLGLGLAAAACGLTIGKSI